MSQLTKDEMRKSLKKIRQSITGEKKKDYDLEITCRFLMTEEYNKADTVLCYAGTKDEIDTRYLIYAALARESAMAEDIMIDLFPIIMGKLLVCVTISK